MWGKKKEPEKPRIQGLVSVEGKGTPGYLIASSDQTSEPNKMSSIRGRLEAAHLIEQSTTFNPALAVPLTTTGAGSGYTYPVDFYDYKDYLDAYYFIPYVARAVDIKQFMIWQMGYDIISEDESTVAALQQFLRDRQTDTVVRDGSLYALIFGNMYWHKQNEVFKPLNPMRIGVKLDQASEVLNYRYEPVFGKVSFYQPKDILHLKYNPEPWAFYGTSSLKRILPTIKALLFMEEKLPLIARRRADPLLAIQIGDPENPVDEPKFKQIKGDILNRNPGEDIYHDGTLKIQEVWQSASVGGRQTVEPILDHFVRNLVAGLGVPEPALGFGGTTTMATADYQERILEAETRNYQRILKRFIETNIFPLAGDLQPAKISWRPMTEEDKATLSKVLEGEIEHGIVSPEWARKRLGYPDEAGEGTVMSSHLQPYALPTLPGGPAQSPNPSGGPTEKREKMYEKILESLDKLNTPKIKTPRKRHEKKTITQADGSKNVEETEIEES